MKKHLIAGLLVAGFVTPAVAASEYYVAQDATQPQMLGRVEEAGRHQGDHARYRWLQEQVRSPFGDEEHDRVQGLSFALTPGMRTPRRALGVCSTCRLEAPLAAMSPHGL